MEWIRNWVIGVVCAAMLIAVADSITPAGTVKKLGKFTGGMVLLLAVISPFLGLDYEALSIALTENRSGRFESPGQKADELSAQMMKTIIVEQAGAYILDKATDLGAVCSVEVTCGMSENHVPYPAAVTVTGNLTESQRERLSRIMEADLAISPEMQTFESGDVE